MSTANSASQSGLSRVAVSALVLCVIAASSPVMIAKAEQVGPFAAVNIDTNLHHYNPESQVSGGFKVQGSETMYPLLSRLTLEFQRRQSKVSIEVKGGGSAKAIEEFLQPPLSKSGKVMLAEERSKQFWFLATSRELFDAEIKAFVRENG